MFLKEDTMSRNEKSKNVAVRPKGQNNSLQLRTSVRAGCIRDIAKIAATELANRL